MKNNDLSILTTSTVHSGLLYSIWSKVFELQQINKIAFTSR